MRISELIEHLQEKLSDHGDLEVETVNWADMYLDDIQYVKTAPHGGKQVVILSSYDPQNTTWD